MKQPGLAVVGTDTGVGKTVISAILLARYAGPASGRASASMRLAYWKPVATGALDDRDSEWIGRQLGDRIEVLAEEYCFDPPVSPHLAARRAGVQVDLAKLLAAWSRVAEGRSVVLEGIGGVLVPLNDRGELFADLLAGLGLPALLVARTALGTINHTLLSLEALRARGIPVAGVALDGPPSPENHEAIERFGKVEVIGEVPPLGAPAPSREALLAAADSFDRRGALSRCL